MGASLPSVNPDAQAKLKIGLGKGGRRAGTLQHDKTLHDGLPYASEGGWPVPEGGFVIPVNYPRYFEILDGLRQLARDGCITVWARPQRHQNSGVHEPIPRDQWGTGVVDLLDTFSEDSR